ncbi:carboxypeptidase Y-deficient [Nowakowskiella sp. JEL0407]|nr:carboxypeptidase Y-deficient [Nowakowskiella sp. JEL0407]KAJ3128847.1 carboxypeptidase Y-deficient [Nowakowskiella sp. JEL0407]
MNSTNSSPFSSPAPHRYSGIRNSHSENSLFNPSYIPSGLICPICNDELLNLAALNQHIDNIHPEETDDTKNILVDWFKKTQKTILDPISKAAKRTEANLNGMNLDRLNAVVKGEAVLVGENEDELEADRMITRSHWQAETGSDYCTIINCGKQLGLRSGKHNCRRCGRLFCEVHCNLFAKLAQDATYDPQFGYWVRVCQLCFTSRDGFSDTYGVSRGKTQSYLRLRKSKIDQVLLEANKLEKRLEKFYQIFSSMNEGTLESDPANNRRSFINVMPNKKSIEQSVVKWEDDNVVNSCPICEQSFNSITRKHHCRLCGRVVCGTDSMYIPVRSFEPTKEDSNTVTQEIRACKDCNRLVFRRVNLIKELSNTPPIVKIDQESARLRSAIEDVLPKFNSLLVSITSRKNLTADHPEYIAAARHRKKLMDYFAELDKLGKRAKSIPSKSVYFQRFHKNYHLATVQYLQSHMFTIQLLPNVSSRLSTPTLPKKESNPKIVAKTISTVSESSDWVMVPPKSKEDAQLMIEVLQQQRDQVDGFLKDAMKRRKFEDAKSLQTALEEIEIEIQKMSAFI